MLFAWSDDPTLQNEINSDGTTHKGGRLDERLPPAVQYACCYWVSPPIRSRFASRVNTELVPPNIGLKLWLRPLDDVNEHVNKQLDPGDHW
jgi:hypothetical protein